VESSEGRSAPEERLECVIIQLELQSVRAVLTEREPLSFTHKYLGGDT
jgi:hypothetical protein